MRKIRHVIAAALATVSGMTADAAEPKTSATPGQAQAAPVKAQQTTPPPYTPVRWNENWSYLRNTTHTDFFDPIKYIPLGNDPDWYLSIGGQARYRYENFKNLNFDPPSPPPGIQDDDGYHLIRLFLHADLHMGRNVRVFGQVKSAMEDDREPGPRVVDADEFDVHQLFVDFKLDLGAKDSVTLRLGRQELLYGAQRFISPLDWVNTRRTFEGGKIATSLGNWGVDLFWVHPVDIEKESWNWADKDTNFVGVYSTVGLPTLINKANTKLDIYALALNRNNALFALNSATTGGDEDRYTVGARLAGNPKPFDFDVELTYQFGEFEDLDISAWSVATEVGYAAERLPMKPRVYVGFDYASGDSDPNDDEFNTFNQLFPLAHAYFGYIDAIGRQNVIDVHPGIEFTVLEKARWAQRLLARVDYHWFWRASDEDAVYSAPSGANSQPPVAGVLRGDLGSDETFIGSELDFVVNWQIDRHILIHAGYSHFFAGTFIEDTGADDDIDFFYGAISFTF